MSTGISWTDDVWNIVTGCTKIATGCKHCYAEKMHKRLTAMGQPKYARPFSEVVCHPEALDDPLHWRKPKRVFVNSMADLFHKDVPFEFIAAVFGVMAATPHITYQILTKRPERMAEFFEWFSEQKREWADNTTDSQWNSVVTCWRFAERLLAERSPINLRLSRRWPLPNVWLGVSASTQADLYTAEPHLNRTPAAVRFLSLEPLLERIDLEVDPHFLLDWVIVGGESGPGARLCDPYWIEDIVGQCLDANCPVFVKQLGACALEEFAPGCDRFLALRNRKGADPDEWPEYLRVQQFPEVPA